MDRRQFLTTTAGIALGGAAGRRPMITSSPTAVKRWRLCRRPTTAKPRWRTSTSHSRRKRCSPHATGNGSTQTARSPIGCSNRPTSSWRMPGSRTSHPPASIGSEPLSQDHCLTDAIADKRQLALPFAPFPDHALRRHQQECTAHAGHFRSRQRPTVTAVCPRLPTIRGTPGTIAASRWLTERQHCRRGISPGIRRTWLAAATPAPPESAAIPAIPC